MPPKIISKDSFIVAGILARTTNAAEMVGDGVIGAMWQRFSQEQIAAKISGQKNPGTILAIYTKYESDYSGEYTFMIGVEIGDAKNIPDGISVINIPAARYALHSTASGAMPNIVLDAWQEIWSMDAEALGGERAYKTDFEVYDSRSANPQSSQVDIYLSINPLVC